MECALCKNMLHGVPHGKKINALKKLSKTQRRPSVPFAGILCGHCREMVAVETVKVAMAQKKLAQVELRVQPYVKQLQASVN
jgi:ribosomal protein L34E